MPFDLDATTHQFVKREDGILEKVVADDPNDRQQIKLIREHLYEEASCFRRGDFADPAEVHGGEMPGLAQLESSAEQIRITYQPLPDGALIRMSTESQGLIKALHAWADAQVSDHGGHAEGAT